MGELLSGLSTSESGSGGLLAISGDPEGLRLPAAAGALHFLAQHLEPRPAGVRTGLPRAAELRGPRQGESRAWIRVTLWAQYEYGSKLTTRGSQVAVHVSI